jgi:effector-binding domain-containing protein
LREQVDSLNEEKNALLDYIDENMGKITGNNMEDTFK